MHSGDKMTNCTLTVPSKFLQLMIFNFLKKVAHMIADIQMHCPAMSIYRLMNISIPLVTSGNSKVMVMIEATTV